MQEKLPEGKSPLFIDFFIIDFLKISWCEVTKFRYVYNSHRTCIIISCLAINGRVRSVTQLSEYFHYFLSNYCGCASASEDKNKDSTGRLAVLDKRYFNESLRVKLDVWISNRVNFPQDIREDMGLFLDRYSLRFRVRIACNGCTKHIDRHRYRCLDWFDVYLYSNCYINEKVTGEHRTSHTILELR